MKKVTGNLRKMKTILASPVEYYFRIGEQEIFLNDLLGKNISLAFTGVINCIQCGRKTNKSFQQGYCYPCMQRLNECNNCAIFPERCKVEEGGCPEDDWAHAHCHAKQIVYLANSSGLKVGITRESHVPMRWIDQGAIQAIPIFKANNRYQCGLMEVAIKQNVSDRTNWRAMLKNDVNKLDLLQERDRLLLEANLAVQSVLDKTAGGVVAIEQADVVDIEYPVLQYPQKITSLSLDKTPEISAVLQGIKGQYLILDAGVLNIRKFGGYEVGCSFG